MWPKKRHLAFWEMPNDSGSSEPAPGTGEESGVSGDPTAAEPSTPDSGSQTPQSIPYSRFKEVNDARRALEEQLAPIRELQQAGYGADDLQRLVAWETEFAQDPVAGLRHVVSSLEDGMPDEVKQALLAALEGTVKPDATDPSGSSDGTADEGVDDVIPLEKLPPEVRESVERDRARQAEERQNAVSAAFDQLLNAWDEMDKADKISTPNGSKLAWIAVAARDEADPVAILSAARAGYLADREEVAKEIVESIRNGDKGPRSVPGGGSGTARSTAPAKPRSLHEATKMAAAAYDRGTLVMEE